MLRAFLVLILAGTAASCSSYGNFLTTPAPGAQANGGAKSGPSPEDVAKLEALQKQLAEMKAMAAEADLKSDDPVKTGHFATSFEPDPDVVGTVVAVVNGDIITKEEVLRDTRPIFKAIDNDESLSDAGRDEKKREVLAEVLKNKVDRRLVLQEAKRVIKHDEAERIEAAADDRIKDEIRYVGTATRVKDLLAQSGQTIEEHRQNEIDNRRIRLLLVREVDMYASPTPGEMQKYYADHSKDFDKKAEVVIREIFVSNRTHPGKGEAEARAAEARKRVENGADFAKMAQEYSDGPNAAAGGLWEPAAEGSGTFRAEVEKAAFSLKPGQMSDVIETEIGAHVIRVEELHPGGTLSFTQVQDKVLAKLHDKKFDELYRKFIRKLWEKSYVDIHWK